MHMLVDLARCANLLRVVGELEAQGVLNNTYIIYMGDNGFHIGNHNLRCVVIYGGWSLRCQHQPML